MESRRRCRTRIAAAVFLCALNTNEASSLSEESPHLPVGNRFPLPCQELDDGDCVAGALCAGPGRTYPVGRTPGTVFKSRFVVPDLPREHDPVRTTYYDYLNIFWGEQPKGGYYNQFVPQLMLGNALANSSNHPEYKPQWIQMEKWHIGAQYFMGLCVKNETYPDGFECDAETWVGRAATGRLIAVEPGEVVETSFRLVRRRQTLRSEHTKLVWHLRMGVVNGGPDRTSVVVADRPFMGLVASSQSWDEEVYDDVYVGSCLENYGMTSAANYPPEWRIGVDAWSPYVGTWWADWKMHEPRKCPWQPKSTVKSAAGTNWQRAVWKASLDDAGNSLSTA